MMLDYLETNVAAGQSFVFEGKDFGRCGLCKEPILPPQEVHMETPWEARKPMAYHAPCAEKVRELCVAERELADALSRHRQANP